MSNGLDQVPENDYSSQVKASYFGQDSMVAKNEDASTKNWLSIDRHLPSNSNSYQEIANTHFKLIDTDYVQAKVLYTQTGMKGRGSKRLEGFPIIFWDLKAFMKWVKAEAECVAFEVTVTQRNQHQEDLWSKAKKAFQAELDRIIQQRQAKL